MPSVYAHHSFGRKVTAKLPEEIKTIIENHKEEFEAGLQGPDFLFFYHPFLKLRTNQIGYWQHKQPLTKYLHHLLPILRKEGSDSGVYAYILGFLCHYMLDSECHTFIIPLSQRPGYNHLAIETEFDRHLIRKDGHRPLTYPVWKKIPYSKHIVDTIVKAYKPLRISREEVREALYSMRFYKWLLTGGGHSIKRFLVRLFMHLSLHYRQLEGHMMGLFPKSYARKTNQSLQFLYDNAITLTSDILQDFHLSVWQGKPLHERFSCNFRSNEPC